MKLFNFDNSYHKLSNVFYAEVLPEKPPMPELIIFNETLAEQLGIEYQKINSDELAHYLSGSKLPEGSEPLAMAYAGHQFEHFTMLGDGRAILLGEHVHEQKYLDIQLKGCGKTPFSRGGDGLATLRAMLREYLISECMHALGVPTSRSLAVVKTGKKVFREVPHDGAVLTRIMESHIRVGTFEYARQFLDFEEQNELLDYALTRHFPKLENSENRALDFLQNVADRQLELIIHWMRIGFIHGVMNTDNMHIGGQTFDYGPCAFMNAYDPKTVFSSIDRNGRYAYGNQPEIALWNLSVLAGTLLPQIDKDQARAIDAARKVLNNFAGKYKTRWQEMMSAKIGFSEASHASKLLIERLLSWMQENKADYTNTFLVLADKLPSDAIPLNDDLKHWILDWRRELKNSKNADDYLEIMSKFNPEIIPRNAWVEDALDAATYQNDYRKIHEIIAAVKTPKLAKNFNFPNFDQVFDENYKTFCGT
jgi:uncharacterized protein YdiU (UPF0061 family)